MSQLRILIQYACLNAGLLFLPALSWAGFTATPTTVTLTAVENQSPVSFQMVTKNTGQASVTLTWDDTINWFKTIVPASATMTLGPGQEGTWTMWADIQQPWSCSPACPMKPGTYTGSFRLYGGGQSVTVPVILTITPAAPSPAPSTISSITLTPSAPSIQVNQTQQFVATARNASGRRVSGLIFTWTSSNPAVASITNSGLASGLSEGIAMISATNGTVTSNPITLTVAPTTVSFITLTPAAPSIQVQQTQQFVATATDASGTPISGLTFTWRSSNPTVASVSNSGLASGLSQGTTTITATNGTMTSNSITLTVVPTTVSFITLTPAAPSIQVHQTQQFVATATDMSGNPMSGLTFTWTSSNPTVASVSNSGLASGLSQGTTTITATNGTMTSNSITLTVVPSAVSFITLTPAAPSIQVQQTQQFVATATDTSGNPMSGLTFTWTSSNPAVASISSSGLATGLSEGATTIAATNGTVTSNQVTLTVTPLGSTSTGFVYPLTVGPTSRYLVDQNGKPFLLVGDTAWSMIAALSDSDVDLYLESRKQLGFTGVLVNLIERKFAANPPANFYRITPFIGQPFTTPPKDDYFAHVDYIIQSAAAKGIIIFLDPLYLGNGCGNEGWCADVQAATSSQMMAWGQYVGNRYKNYDNIVWMIGGDTDPTPVKSKVQAMVDGILSADSRHLFTAHNGGEQMAVTPWPGATWLKVNNVYTTSGIAYQPILNASSISPPMPVFLVEAVY
ncbi:MAG TPA: DUF4038 domain-containing protein, partial [Nitrospiraceae bacterium]|nr:DUF4038 domain-containing protein [Nitrospiraceae bacterium]